MKWFNAKKQIDSLPKDWKVVARSYEQTNKNAVESETYGKYKRTFIKMKPIDGFTTQVIAYKNKDGSTQRAWYVIFNEFTGTVYERKIS